MMQTVSRRDVLIGMISTTALVASTRQGQAAPQSPARLKVIELLARRPGSSHTQFIDQWRSHHTSGAVPIPRLLGLTLQDVTVGPPRNDISTLAMDRDIDGIAEYIFDTHDAALAGFADSGAAAWRDQMTTFIEAGKTLLLQDSVIVPVVAPRPTTRNFAMLSRRADTDVNGFRQAWHEVHGELATHVPHLRGFVLGDVTGTLDDTDAPAGRHILQTGVIDGVAEAYYLSVADQTEMRNSPEAKLWFTDGAASIGKIRSFNSTEILSWGEV